MNWKTAKTVLLLLLLSVNLILGGLWLYREMQTRAGESQAGKELCALLGQNGLFAKQEQLGGAVSLTYDAEQLQSGETKRELNGLPVWGQSTSENGRLTITETELRWGAELPVDGRVSYSAGYCLLKMTEEWGESGKTLETCELGYAAEALAAEAVRLKPCWRFVISGEEYYYSAV